MKWEWEYIHLVLLLIQSFSWKNLFVGSLKTSMQPKKTSYIHKWFNSIKWPKKHKGKAGNAIIKITFINMFESKYGQTTNINIKQTYVQKGGKMSTCFNSLT